MCRYSLGTGHHSSYILKMELCNSLHQKSGVWKTILSFWELSNLVGVRWLIFSGETKTQKYSGTTSDLNYAVQENYIIRLWKIHTKPNKTK